MDIDSCEEKVRDLSRQMEQAIVAEAMRLYHSGGIETEVYSDREFTLPKILVTAAAHAKVDIFKPLYGPDYEDMRNLMSF